MLCYILNEKWTSQRASSRPINHLFQFFLTNDASHENCGFNYWWIASCFCSIAMWSTDLTWHPSTHKEYESSTMWQEISFIFPVRAVLCASHRGNRTGPLSQHHYLSMSETMARNDLLWQVLRDSSANLTGFSGASESLNSSFEYHHFMQTCYKITVYNQI